MVILVSLLILTSVILLVALVHYMRKFGVAGLLDAIAIMCVNMADAIRAGQKEHAKASELNRVWMVSRRTISTN